MDRRGFLGTVAAGWLASAALPERKAIAGSIVGASHGVGHRLRGGATEAPSGPSEKADVVVVGGGISGLSAAWRLRDAELDVHILELEPRIGGTSAWGEEGVTPHPWGAHYLAAPNPEARATLRLLSEIDVVTGWDAAGRPRFDPKVLCHAPSERLYFKGKWHPGLIPDSDALTPQEVDELARFSAMEDAWTARIGSDGRPAFQIPIEQSSRDPEILALDRITMAAWLAEQGLSSPFLLFWVRYAMRDDFGGDPEDVSAWAGLHYFAARKLRSPELSGSHYLVWPEGNGRLARALFESARPRVTRGALVTRVEETSRGVVVDYFDVKRSETRRIEARAAIIAAPAFITRRIVLSSFSEKLPVRTTSPWIVANLHVTRAIDPNLPWDSVLYDGVGLGYVDASHQHTTPSESTVLTYFRAYGGADVRGAREALLAASWDDLASDVLRDLAPAHPALRDELSRIDVMIWGHAMPRPRAGFLGETPFDVPCALGPRIAWAHVDQSGVALFEEAQLRGVRAAETVAPAIGVSLGETYL